MKLYQSSRGGSFCFMFIITSLLTLGTSSPQPTFVHGKSQKETGPPGHTPQQQKRNVINLNNFDELIYPMSSQIFHETYFGKKTLHLHGSGDGNKKRSQLFNTSDVLKSINRGYIKPMENMKFVFRDIGAFVKDEFDPVDPGSSVVTETTFNDHFNA